MAPPAVDEATLRGLIARAAEADDLDFKQTVHLDDASGRTEMAKDIAAMASAGGYLVVGVDDSGKPVPPGTQLLRDKLDPARLTGMLGRWLPDGVVFVCATHEVDGVPVTLVGVEPHPDGLVVMKADGEFEDERGAKRQRFRAGQTLVRRNTQSVPAVQSDVASALRRLNARLPSIDAALVPARGTAKLRTMNYEEELRPTRMQRVRRSLAYFGEALGPAVGPPLGVGAAAAVSAGAGQLKVALADYALDLVVRNHAPQLWEDVLVWLEFPEEVVVLHEHEVPDVLAATNPAIAVQRFVGRDNGQEYGVELSAGDVRSEATSSVMRLFVLTPPVREAQLRVPWRLTARNASGRCEGLLDVEFAIPPGGQP